MGRLGGKSSPMLPEPVSNPVAKSSLKPRWMRTNDRRPPRARIVTPEPPVNVVKKAQSRMLITARPPGNQPKKVLKNLTSRSPALLSDMIAPTMVKSGMAGIISPVSMV